VEPGDGSLDDRALGQRHEPVRVIGSFDDLDFERRQDFGERIVRTLRLSIVAAGAGLAFGLLATPFVERAPRPRQTSNSEPPFSCLNDA
jgi:hypothetical protein